MILCILEWNDGYYYERERDEIPSYLYEAFAQFAVKEYHTHRGSLREAEGIEFGKQCGLLRGTDCCRLRVNCCENGNPSLLGLQIAVSTSTVCV